MRSPGYIRVHLLTLLFAMLTTGVVLGVNLRPRTELKYEICYLPATDTFLVNNKLVIQEDGAYFYGWPWTLAKRYTISDKIIPCSDLTAIQRDELRHLSVRGQRYSESFNTQPYFSSRAPSLYRLNAMTPPTEFDQAWMWDAEPLIQYVCGYLALLFTAMLLLEWRIRRASNPEQDPEPLPEV